MALEVGFGQHPNLVRGELAKREPVLLQLPFDDLDRALPYQGSNEAGMLVSGASWIDIAISVFDRAIM